jgi:hypothetical protein
MGAQLSEVIGDPLEKIIIFAPGMPGLAQGRDPGGNACGPEQGMFGMEARDMVPHDRQEGRFLAKQPSEKSFGA